METMKVKLTFADDVLGTASANKDVHAEFIASKSADAEKIKEELESLGAEELMDKALTVFPRDEDGTPILFDYQIRGFIKEALGAMVEFAPIELSKKPAIKISKFTCKRMVDNYIFVTPRKIPFALPDGASKDLEVCTRPLRATTMKGDRVALASSESVPEGSTVEFSISIMHKKLVPFVEQCLEWGINKGIGQWRNSGKGRFTFEIVE